MTEAGQYRGTCGVVSLQWVFAFVVASACDPAGVPGPPDDLTLQAVEVASGLDRPVFVTAPEGDSRLFVVEQSGTIRVVDGGGALLNEPFLDLSAIVVDGGERGLLGMAFHPEYASSGHLYVNFTGAGGATRIERYTVSADPNRADPASGRLILTVAQPFSNHNGGMIAFGPDGMLYIGMGDGGDRGDPLGHGQNVATLLGAMLRIDVDGGDPYAIPADNPFVDAPNARPEIWASGLRNPWRFSFDRTANLIYIADVGQNRREEVNVAAATAAGLNYGWNTMEGTECYRPATGCAMAGLTLPVLDYPTADGQCAVTGGYVYRGDAVPALRGSYFHADFCSGAIRSFRLGPNSSVTDQRTWPLGGLGNVTSFGEDGDRELYVVVQQGRVYRLESEP